MKYQYQYLVEPFDVLFFRNNKAFDFGDWYSEGFFPPLPSTFQGFVRTSILLKHGLLINGKVNWDEATPLIGNEREFPLDLKGPFLFQGSSEQQFYFVTPRDIIKEKDHDGYKGRQIRLSGNSMQSDLGQMYFADEEGKPEYLSFEKKFIGLNALDAYRKTGHFCVEKEELVLTEEHYGISLGNDKKVKEHHFYLTPYQRLNKDVGLFFELQSDKKIEKLDLQYSRLGSEGRGAKIIETDMQLSLKSDDKFYRELAAEKRFKIIFLQPGILPNHVIKMFKKENKITLNGLDLKLIYAVTDNILKISGVDFKNESKNVEGHTDEKGKNYRLKPMVNALPAGTVLYFEILNDADTQTIGKILQSIDDTKIEYGKYARMGYNHIVLGKII